MANLLNVFPQVNNSPSASPSAAAPKGFADSQQNSELKQLFDQNLGKSLKSATESPLNQESVQAPLAEGEMLDEVALSNGLVAAQKDILMPLQANPLVVSEAKGITNPVMPKQSTPLSHPSLEGLRSTAEATQVPQQVQKFQHTQRPQQAQQSQQSQPLQQSQPVQTAKILESLKGAGAIPFGVDAADLSALIPEEHSIEVTTRGTKKPSSSLSTDQFLNLREISRNPSPVGATQIQMIQALNERASLNGINPRVENPLGAKNFEIGAKALEPARKDSKRGLNESLALAHPLELRSFSGTGVLQTTLDAKVTQTAESKPVLTPESIHQITQQVNLIGKAQQDGEIKIRLRPDHLGELRMSVRTEGRNVSVEIKADNHDARKIIEESLSSLREQLSSQNLTLARVDVVNQPTSSSSPEAMPFQMDSGTNWGDSSRHFGSQSQERDSSDFYRDEIISVPVKTGSRSRIQNLNSSRLDLIA